MATNRDSLKVIKSQNKSMFLERIPAAMRKIYEKASTAVYNKTSYMPHQGARECARRLRQIKSGFIKA
jgi:hypothetical protein